MPSSSCFYLYTENLSLPVLLPIFAYKKDTCQNLPVSLLYFSKIKHLFHILCWYGNSGNRLTWSSFLTLVPSGFAPLPFNRFAFKIISFFKRPYHTVFRTSIIFLRNLHIFYFCFWTSLYKKSKSMNPKNITFFSYEAHSSFIVLFSPLTKHNLLFDNKF